MTDDGSKVGRKPSTPRDSDQASKAFVLEKVQSREGQSFRGYGENSALLFEQAMAQTRMAICLSDPRQEDHPIVFANRAFQELTGYREEEVLGRNCRFLQGPDTDRTQVAQIRTAIEQEKVTVVELLNYRKNGESFWNALHLGPIYDDDGTLLYFFGSQWDVTEVHAARASEQQQKLLAREISHRMKNMFAVINAVVSMAGRGSPERRAVAEDISGRILALGRAHEATLENASRTATSDLRRLLQEVLSAYDARGRIELTGPEVLLNSNVVSMIALTVHELAINSVKYGALSETDGTLRLGWHTAAGQDDEENVLKLAWVERGGPKIPSPPERRGLGGSIVDNLILSADGTVDRDWNPDGLEVSVCIPLPARQAA